MVGMRNLWAILRRRGGRATAFAHIAIGRPANASFLIGIVIAAAPMQRHRRDPP
jgi:hypothetical protein